MTGHTCFELCTESLGFESGDCSVGEGEEELDLLPSAPTNDEKVENVFEQNKDEGGDDERIEGKRQKSYPPPLRWMGTHGAGKQSSYMKSERKDGRLILTEVRIERPEVFQVTRENGRLRFCVPWTAEKVEEEAMTREEEMEPVRRDGFCSHQGEWSSNRMHQWWHQRFVTTA